jgi:hypothetical protein
MMMQHNLLTDVNADDAGGSSVPRVPRLEQNLEHGKSLILLSFLSFFIVMFFVP